jgi:hypothetical protein
MSEMTLGHAQVEFVSAPDRFRAKRLLSVATQYWRDDMIGDDTYAHQVCLVRDWLAGDNPRPPEPDIAPDADREGGSCVNSGPTVELRFRPQAWINDYAVAVDREHPDTWVVPLDLFLERFPTEEDWSSLHHERDEMRLEGSAPQWVRDWSGPFEVELASDVPDPWTLKPDVLLSDSASADWPNEAAIRHTNGVELRVPAYPEDVSYVRVIRADGTEIAHWSIDEIAEDPVETIGALVGAVIGGRKI